MSGIVMIRQNDVRNGVLNYDSNNLLTRSLSQTSNKSISLHSASSSIAIENCDQSEDEKNISEQLIHDIPEQDAGNEPLKNEVKTYKSNLIADFESTIKSIAASHKDNFVPEKLSSGQDGINDLEEFSAKRIESVLSDSNRKKFIRMNTAGRKQTFFPIALKNFLACLSVFNDEELKSNAAAINKLSQDLSILFKKQDNDEDRLPSSYHAMHDKFHKKFDKFMDNFLNKKNVNTDTILLNNLKNHVFAGEHGNHVASIFNQKNNVNDVFTESLDGYLKGLKTEASLPAATYSSQELTYMLHEIFAFRDILKESSISDISDEHNQVEPNNQDQAEDYETCPDINRRESIIFTHPGINELPAGSNTFFIKNVNNYKLNLPKETLVSVAFMPEQELKAIEAGPSMSAAYTNIAASDTAVQLSNAKPLQTKSSSDKKPGINYDLKILSPLQTDAPIMDVSVLTPDFRLVTADIERLDISTPVAHLYSRSTSAGQIVASTNFNQWSNKLLLADEQVMSMPLQQPEKTELTDKLSRKLHLKQLSEAPVSLIRTTESAVNLAASKPLRRTSASSLPAAKIADGKNSHRRQLLKQSYAAPVSLYEIMSPVVKQVITQKFSTGLTVKPATGTNSDRRASAPSLTAAEVTAGKNADRRLIDNQPFKAPVSLIRTAESAVSLAASKPLRRASAPSLTAAKIADGKNSHRRQLLKQSYAAPVSLYEIMSPVVKQVITQKFSTGLTVKPVIGTNSDRRMVNNVRIKTPQA